MISTVEFVFVESDFTPKLFEIARSENPPRDCLELDRRHLFQDGNLETLLWDWQVSQ